MTSPPPRLRVMTYNIRHARGGDGRVDLERVARVIEAAAVDLVALQEVDVGRARSGGEDQAQRLAARLGMTAAFAPCIEHGPGEQYGIATLARLPVVASDLLRLPAESSRRRGQAPEPRCALVVRVAWPAADGDVTFVNTHLSIHGRERAGQVAALLAALDTEVVVAGDFNLTPWSAPYRAFTRQFRAAAPGARTWPARLAVAPIDHIFVRGPLRVVRAGAFTGGPARQASDHLPVVAELE